MGHLELFFYILFFAGTNVNLTFTNLEAKLTMASLDYLSLAAVPSYFYAIPLQKQSYCPSFTDAFFLIEGNCVMNVLNLALD